MENGERPEECVAEEAIEILRTEAETKPVPGSNFNPEISQFPPDVKSESLPGSDYQETTQTPSQQMELPVVVETKAKGRSLVLNFTPDMSQLNQKLRTQKPKRPKCTGSRRTLAMGNPNLTQNLIRNCNPKKNLPQNCHNL